MRGYTNERLGKWKQSKFALEQIDVTNQVRLKKINTITFVQFVFTRLMFLLDQVTHFS